MTSVKDNWAQTAAAHSVSSQILMMICTIRLHSGLKVPEKLPTFMRLISEWLLPQLSIIYQLKKPDSLLMKKEWNKKEELHFYVKLVEMINGNRIEQGGMCYVTFLKIMWEIKKFPHFCEISKKEKKPSRLTNQISTCDHNFWMVFRHANYKT